MSLPAQAKRPGHAWVLLALVLAGVALLPLDAQRWAWDRPLLATEPWRWFTGAVAHWSPWHGLANAAGALLLAWVGWRAAVPTRFALAWGAAGPIGQALLWLHPELQRVAGLSGWLHAGVAVLCVALWRAPEPRARWVGLLVFVGLLIKLGLEQPWSEPLRFEPMWGAMPVAPWAHAAGVLAGLGVGALGLFFRPGRCWR